MISSCAVTSGGRRKITGIKNARGNRINARILLHAKVMDGVFMVFKY
jgi:hypothetical protein